MATTSNNKIANIWTKFLNPLRTLNTTEIDRMLLNARWGNDIRLQLAFAEIEKTSPIFSICISKRISGVQDRNWDIVPLDETPEAKSQAEKIKAVFLKCDTKNEDGLTEAIRHLTLATFRGRAAVKPFFNDKDELILKKLENWNFLSYLGKTYWNPQSNVVTTFDSSTNDLTGLGLVELPKDEIAYIVDDKPLDWSGIAIFLRLLIGEEQWARAVEKFGIPQVLLTAPEGTPETDFLKFNFRAQAIYEGASGTLPAGTNANVLTAARGQDPFTEYIQHQMEMFTILATGSTLATLGGTQGATGAGMGSTLASEQTALFNSLVSFDCKRISNAFLTVIDKCVKHLGFKDTLCRFSFVEEDRTTPAQYLELAEKCKAIGLTVDVAKLKELTKLQFISDVEKDVWQPEATLE